MLHIGIALAGLLADAFRSRQSLLAENALLRHQLTILHRSVRKPRLTRFDRFHLLVFAALTQSWQNVLRVVQPETLMEWRRAGFKAFWRWRSRPPAKRRIEQGTIALIRAMATDNRLWGAERIRGELLKLGISIAKRTVQRYMRIPRSPGGPGGQRWATFMRNHADKAWACDFLQAYDAFFRPIFAFIFIELATRKIVHCSTTRAPSHAWIVQQLRNATPWGSGPKFLIRDRDRKFAPDFDLVAERSGISIVRTAIRAPNMNAICERFFRSLRRECLDHVLVLSDRHFERIVHEYVRYYNESRPHQGLGQRTPMVSEPAREGRIIALPILGGLHHEYRRAA
jgi:putative transposase